MFLVYSLWKEFVCFIMNGCQIVSNAFSASIEMIRWFLIFVKVVYYINWFAYVEPSLWHWSESHLVIAYDLFLCSIWLFNILLRFFMYFHQRFWPIIFFFWWHLCLVLVSRWWWLHRMSLWVFLPFNFLEDFEENQYKFLYIWWISCVKLSGPGLFSVGSFLKSHILLHFF